MFNRTGGDKPHVCVVNVGHYRSGSSTLAEAAKSLGMKVYRAFPELTQHQFRDFLFHPEEAIIDWCRDNDGLTELVSLVSENCLVSDGWFAILPFAPDILTRFEEKARDAGVQVKFVASTRDVASTVQSELQHWVRHGLEDEAGLSSTERGDLEEYLRVRTQKHHQCVESLRDQGKAKILPLECINAKYWSHTMSSVSDYTEDQWSKAISKVGRQNSNPPLPIEGVLLTMRVGDGEEALKSKIASVERLLDQIEKDSLCRYLVVLGIDGDEATSEGAEDLIKRLRSRSGHQKQMQSFHAIKNPTRAEGQPFPLCSIWNKMAVEAWKNGADWVVLLGDDVEVHSKCHYRAIYRSFLDIASRLNVPFGFGCPWWNDKTFPRFPTFPCIGKAHLDIFGGLIPGNRRDVFVNQDLDPYLQCLYLKFKAAPCVSHAVLSNGTGGNLSSGEARYERVEAIGWRDFVWEDIDPTRRYLPDDTEEALVLDVIVPSYRVKLEYLRSICSLEVPEYLCVQFIIIVDNVDALSKAAASIEQIDDSISLHQGERILEEHLSSLGNNVRVRCNETNLGASASRNRGLDESAAEFFLNLDDDLKPNEDLLERYGSKLKSVAADPSVIGLIGLVRFPRRHDLPLKHAAVLMSYLTFMFEIAEAELYPHPAWGVTANILYRRTNVRFGEGYAKTGGGEDVDFSLNVAKTTKNAKLVTVRQACVVHPFWPGSVLTLCSHFFNWAVGDGGLLKKFPEHRYWSFPNFPETFLFLAPLLLWAAIPENLPVWMFIYWAVDFFVDFSNAQEFQHRRKLLFYKRHFAFCFAAHILANFYVIVLEHGRLWGHLKRKDLTMICHRFDWHCGKLPHAPSNFRQREMFKFVGFWILVAAIEIPFGMEGLDWKAAR